MIDHQGIGRVWMMAFAFANGFTQREDMDPDVAAEDKRILTEFRELFNITINTGSPS